MDKYSEKIINDIIGGKLMHLKSGRPFFSESFDVSISHKDNITEVKMVLSPYRVGIDVESLFPGIRAELFLSSVIAREEIDLLNKFQLENGCSLESAVAVFWSIKESFFKCLDYDLKPGKVRILDLSKNGKVRVILLPEIKNVMRRRKLELFSTGWLIKGEYVYTETIMKAI